MRRLASAIALLCLLVTTGAEAETTQRGNLRVSFSGVFSPRKLPRHGAAPIGVQLGGRISTTDGSDPPGLRGIEIELNRHGRLDPGALPTCGLEEIQPSTTEYARRVCGDARVGEGRFSAAVLIPEQSPYPSRGTVTVFNGVKGGRPVILLHVYGAEPVPTSFTLPLKIGRGHGDFGAVLKGVLPSVDAHIGFVTGISLKLNGGRGRFGRSYLTAGCPAPKGFSSVIFPLVRASFSFNEGQKLGATLLRACRATSSTAASRRSPSREGRGRPPGTHPRGGVEGVTRPRPSRESGCGRWEPPIGRAAEFKESAWSCQGQRLVFK